MNENTLIGSWCEDGEARLVTFVVRGNRIVIREKLSGPWVELVYGRPTTRSEVWLNKHQFLEALGDSYVVAQLGSCDAEIEGYIQEILRDEISKDCYLVDFAQGCEAQGITCRYKVVV